METQYLVDKANFESSQAKYKSASDSVDSAQAQLAQANSKLNSSQVKKISSEAPGRFQQSQDRLCPGQD